MHLDANDLRKGYLVRHNGQIQAVVHWNILRNDRRAFVQMKLKDLKTGKVSELKEHGDSKYEVLDNATIDLSHSYQDGGEEVFYTPSGEEHRCSREAAADALKWKSELYRGMLVEGQLTFVSLPNVVIATVVETDPPVRGAGQILKEAVLENGITIRVPTMIATGERIRVDPETLEFRERA